MAISTIGATATATADLGATIFAAFQVPAGGSGKFAVTGGLPAGSYVVEFRGSSTASATLYGYIGTTPTLIASNITTYSSGNQGSVGLNNYIFTTTTAFDGLYVTNFSGAVGVRKWTAATPATLTVNTWASFGATFPSTSMIGPYSVASSGSTIVAVNYTSGPFVYVSTDSGSNFNNTATSVSYLGNIGWGNNLFVAAPWGSASASVTTSPTGATWTSRTMTINQIWNGNPHYAGSLPSPKWIVPGVNGSANVSTDGVTWTNAPISSGTGNFFVGSGGGVAIALRAGESTYFTSTDLSTWTSRTFPTTVSGTPFIIYAGGKFIVSNMSNSVFYTSTNGINWTSNNNPVGTAAPITFTNNTYNYGIVQNQPNGATSTSWLSTDLVNWYSRTWASNTNYAGYPTTTTSHFLYLPNNNGSIAPGRTSAALDTLI
jgi:hypothetical protein